MAAKIILHQYHLSPFNQKIQRMLNYKGVPFEERYWLLAQSGKVKKFNPIGKLPALEHDGRLVCDSTDMAHYIEHTFPERPLIPSEPALRGQVHVIEDWADESLYFYEMHLRFTTPGNAERNVPRLVEHENALVRRLLTRVVPGGMRKITRAQGVGRKSMEQLLVDTERHVQAVAGMLVGNDWLVGNRITLADLAVYPMFQCLRDADEVREMMEGYPAVAEWLLRIEQCTSERAA